VPWVPGTQVGYSPRPMPRYRRSHILVPGVVSNMHGKQTFTLPSLFIVICPLTVAWEPVGLERGIGWLSRIVHRHSQLRQCIRVLPECDLPRFYAQCRRPGRRWCFLPIWLDSTGALTPTLLCVFCDKHGWSVVHRHPSTPQEWNTPIPVHSGYLFFDTQFNCLTSGT